MIQNGMYMNLGYPPDSSLLKAREYAETNRQRQESAEDTAEVGLADSTRGMGKPCTRGSGQQWYDGLSTGRLDTRRSE